MAADHPNRVQQRKGRMSSWSLMDSFCISLKSPWFRYSNRGKASLHARRPTTFYTFHIQNPAEGKLFCLRLLLCTRATQPALEKCICITWSQLLNSVSNPPSAPWNCPSVWFGRRYSPKKHISPLIYHSFCEFCDLLFVKIMQQCLTYTVLRS